MKENVDAVVVVVEAEDYGLEAAVVDSPAEPAAAPEVAEPVASATIPSRKNPDIFISVKALSPGTNTQNSRSVYLAQEALISRGFLDAGVDNRGTFGEGTEKSLREFCGCAHHPCAPHPMRTVELLFEDTDYTIID